MRTTLAVVILLLLSATGSQAMDPPVIEWEKEFGTIFYDVWETNEGNYIVAGRKWYSDFKKTVFLYSPSGELLWEYGESVYPNNLHGYAIIQLPSGDFVATGYGISEASSTQASLSIYKVSLDGQAIWSKLYILGDGSKSYGYAVTQLPDGGFAICGLLDPSEGYNQAWILRTDSQGDTLWTREWGWLMQDRARGILCIDSVITVLCSGRLEGDPGGTYIVRYNMDGDLLSEYRIPELEGEYGFDMCEASDQGLLIVDNYMPVIAHTDYYGYFDWMISPPSLTQPYGWSIDTTMDGGFIYGGENNWQEPGKENPCGMISRHDYQGNELWRDYVYNSGCQAIYSVRQLSQGGYIAAGYAFSPENGNQGLLMRYAPETGIESGDLSPTVEITGVSPNPFSSSLSITYNLPSQTEASLTVYDLGGRIVDVIEAGSFPAGEHTVQWIPSEELSAGCYLIRLQTDTGIDVKNCVLLRE